MIDEAQLIPQLLTQGLVVQDDLNRGLQFAEDEGKTLYEALISHGLVEEAGIVRVVSELINVPSVNLGEGELEPDVAKMIPSSLAIRNRALPLKVIDEGEQRILVLAMADPIDVLAMDEIASHTGVNIRPVLAGPLDLEQALETLYRGGEAAAAAAADNIFAELEEISSPDFEVPARSSSSEPSEDSWAALFDDPPAEPAEQGAEESSVISLEMRDRPPTDVFDAISSEAPAQDPEQGGEEADGDVLAAIDADLSPSQRTGGAGMSLDDWEIDDVFNQEDASAPVNAGQEKTEVVSSPLEALKAKSRLKGGLAALKKSGVLSSDDGKGTARPNPGVLAKIKPKKINARTGEEVVVTEEEPQTKDAPAEKQPDSELPVDRSGAAPLTREIEADDFFNFAFEPSEAQAGHGLEEDTAAASAKAQAAADRLKDQTLAPRKKAFRLDDDDLRDDHRKETMKLDAITPSKLFFPDRNKKGVVLPAHISPEVLFAAALRLMIKKGLLDLDEILEEVKNGD